MSIDQQPPPSSGQKYLWLVVVGLVSLVVALVAGMLKSMTGVDLPDTILYSGGAFAATLGICLAVRAALR